MSQEAPIAPTAQAARITFAVLFVLAAGLALAVVWPFWSPLLLGAVLASVFHSLFQRLVTAVRGHRSIAAGLATALLLLVIVGPLGAISGFTAARVVEGLAFLRDRLGIHSMQQLQTSRFSPHGWTLVDRALVAVHVSRGQLEEWTNAAAAAAQRSAERVVALSSTALLHTSIMLIAFYFFLIEGRRLIRWLRVVSPLQARQTGDLLDEFRAVSRATVLGASLAALFQGAVATIGFFLTGVPNAIFFGVLTAVTSFIPLVGNMLVWVPAVVLLWLFGQHASALVLLGWCLLFVVGAEHLGKPAVMRALIGGDHDMHTGIVFLSLLGGIEIFGPMGIVLGPLIFAFFLAMMRIYERDFLVGAAMATNAPPTSGSSAMTTSPLLPHEAIGARP